MQLHEFLDRYSLDNAARNPVAKRKPEAKKEKEVHQMTEDEMLQAAMQASLASQNEDKLRVEDPDDLTRSIGDLSGNGKMKAGEADLMDISEDAGSSSLAPSTSLFSTIPSNRPHTEPTVGPDVTRIQFRHPAGRVIRRFAVADPVRTLYEWLKAEPLEGKEGVGFELVASGKNLIQSADLTIEQAGLKNGTVMIEFLED